MQTIDRHGRFVAEWGAFVVILDNKASHCLAEILWCHASERIDRNFRGAYHCAHVLPSQGLGGNV